MAEGQALYDRVELKEPTGATRTLSRTEFERLPLDQRVRAILGKSLRFFRGASEVPMKDALKDR